MQFYVFKHLIHLIYLSLFLYHVETCWVESSFEACRNQNESTCKKRKIDLQLLFSFVYVFFGLTFVGFLGLSVHLVVLKWINCLFTELRSQTTLNPHTIGINGEKTQTHIQIFMVSWVLFEYFSIQRHMLLYNGLRRSLCINDQMWNNECVLLCVHSIVYVSFGFVISLFFLLHFFSPVLFLIFDFLSIYFVVDEFCSLRWRLLKAVESKFYRYRVIKHNYSTFTWR